MKIGKQLSLDKNRRIIITIYKDSQATRIWQTTTSWPISNQKLLGNYVHEIEILLLAKIRRMAKIIDDRNDKMFFPPRSSSRPRFINLLTSLIPIRLKPRQFILNIGQPKSGILIVRAYAYMRFDTVRVSIIIHYTSYYNYQRYQRYKFKERI